MMEQGSFTYKTEHYYGSKKHIHTISWVGKGEVDSDEIQKWCIENFGQPGYQEEHGEARWLDHTDFASVILIKDEDLTFFLLKWT